MKKSWNNLRKWSVPLILTLAVFLLLRFVFLFGYVPTTSMEPVLERNSFLLGSRIYASLKKGEIIIFKHEGRLLVKRIAALPGEMVDFDSLSYADRIQKPLRMETLLTVPEGCYFVLGDNTQESVDSRYWEFPFVERKDIVAKLIFPLEE